MKITFKYYLQEYAKFREIMCSTEYTMEQKQNAFEGMARVYLLAETKDEQERGRVVSSFLALSEEFERRMLHELFRV